MGLSSTIYCGRQKVRVVEPNGQIRHFHFPITVPDLLRLYPHHFLRHISGSNLDPDAELEGGDTYLLFPLPRLFPTKGAMLPTAKRQPESNPRLPPSAELQNRKRKVWRRRRYWEPSLDMIAENAMLLQTKEEEDRIHRQTVKYKQNYAFKKEPWFTQTRLNVSAGFILSPIF